MQQTSNNISKRLLFRCDGATLPEIGTGHVARDIGIANALVEQSICNKNEIGFIIRQHGPFQIGYDLVQNAGYSVESVVDEDLKWNSIQEAQLIAGLSSSILIIDRLETKEDWMSCVKEQSSQVVTMDDIGSGALLADIVINGILHDLPQGENRYIGYDYLFLNNEIPEKRNGRRSTIKNIVVSFGGYDARNLSGFFLDTLINTPEIVKGNSNLEFLVGTESESVLGQWRKQISKLQYMGWHDVRLLIRTPDFYQRLANADLAIVSGGLTIFEAVASGIPVIGLPQYKHQLESLEKLAIHGAIKIGCHDMLLEQSYFSTILESLINSVEEREVLTKMGTCLIDGKGHDRILNILSPILQ